MRPARARPAPVGWRVPTTATARSPSRRRASPMAYRTGGGSAMARSRAGYQGSAIVTISMASSRSRRRVDSPAATASTMAVATASGTGARPLDDGTGRGVWRSRSAAAGPEAHATTARALPKAATSAPRPTGPRPCAEARMAHAERSSAWTPDTSASLARIRLRSFVIAHPDAEHRQRASAVARRATGGRYQAASSRWSGCTSGESAMSAIVRATRSRRSVPRPLARSASASSITRRVAAADRRHARRRARPWSRPVGRPRWSTAVARAASDPRSDRLPSPPGRVGG